MSAICVCIVPGHRYVGVRIRIRAGRTVNCKANRNRHSLMVGSILYMAAVSSMQDRLRGPGQLLELADPTGGPDCSNRQWLPVAGPAVDTGLSQIEADGDLIVLLGRALGASWAAAPVRIVRSPAGSRAGQQISLAETTATIGTCRESASILPIANCCTNCLVEVVCP